MDLETTTPEEVLEPKPTAEGVAAAEKTLKALRQRPFSERHPELGKMINCQCGLRHRQGERNCEQKFAHRWTVDKDGNKIYTDELLIAGRTPETETVIEAKKVRAVYGAKTFAKRRRNPHPSKAKLQFIELVRKYTPDEYTQEDLFKARRRAIRELGLNKKKTWGCIPPKDAYGFYRVEEKKE